jgi:hypothetical protein
MVDVAHSTMIGVDAHRAYKWTFADAAARAAGTDSGGVAVSSGDVGHLGLQLDTHTLYLLTATGPLAWTAFTGATGPAGAAGATGAPGPTGAAATTTVLSATFTTPGVDSSLTGDNGEPIKFTRASAATVRINGATVTAASGEARIDDYGLLVEPAATQLLGSAASLTTLGTGGWSNSGTTVIGGKADPEGGTTAFWVQDVAGQTTMWFYQLGDTSLSPITVSAYFDGDQSDYKVVRLGDNQATHYVNFDIYNGKVLTVHGACRGEIERVKGRLFRCSMTVPTGWTAGLLFLLSLLADNETTATGTGTKHIWVWRPQTEQNHYATSWIASGTRAADTVQIPLANFGLDWCVEIEATPTGGQYWTRGTDHPMFEIGIHGVTPSVCGSIVSGAPVNTTIDDYGTKAFTATAAMTRGPRRIAFASNGAARPAVYVDGRQALGSAAGAGAGIYENSVAYMLCLGANQAGTIGGFRIRNIRVRNTTTPQAQPVGGYQYSWPIEYGLTARTNCVAFLGDSNTQGSCYNASIVPFPSIAAGIGTARQAHNYGVGSNSTQQALARLKADIVGHGYTKLVVLIGINDINVGIPTDFTIANIGRIVSTATADGMHVYLCTLFPNGYSDSRLTALTAINSAISALASSSVTIVDTYTLLNDGTGKISSTYDYDGGSLHLSQAGQNAVGAAVATALSS